MLGIIVQLKLCCWQLWICKNKPVSQSCQSRSITCMQQEQVILLVEHALETEFWPCSTYLSPTWSCTCCVCNWSIHNNTPNNDCTPHVALPVSQGVYGSGFMYVKSFLITSHRLVYNLNAPNTCKHTIVPPPGHCNAIISGCSCHLNRSRRDCVRKV